MNASSSVQSQVLADLYSPTSGAGLTILRNEIGADPGNTIEPNSPGSPSATPTYVPMSQTNQDQGQLWFAQQINSRFGVTNVYGDAWSAPGYMKTNGSAANGGQICGSVGVSCGSGDWRQAYANYLVQYAKDYAAAGVPLTYLGPSNEPDFSANYDSMTMNPAQMASVLDVFGTDREELRAVHPGFVLRGYRLAGSRLVRFRDRVGSGRAGRHRGPHRPRLQRRADLTDPRLEQTRLGNRVVHLRRLQHRLGRRIRRLRNDLGPAHLPGSDRRERQRVPVLVG